MVTRKSRYHGPQFQATLINTQEGLVSPMVFKVSINSVVRHWLSLMVEDRTVVHAGMGHAVRPSLGVFCMEHRLLGSWDLEWLEGALNFLIRLFRKIIPVVNVTK